MKSDYEMMWDFVKHLNDNDIYSNGIAMRDAQGNLTIKTENKYQVEKLEGLKQAYFLA